MDTGDSSTNSGGRSQCSKRDPDIHLRIAHAISVM